MYKDAADTIVGDIADIRIDYSEPEIDANIAQTITNYESVKRSIHDRLGENKQKSAAQKAEKSVEKAAKKDKGEEL